MCVCVTGSWCPSSESLDIVRLECLVDLVVENFLTKFVD